MSSGRASYHHGDLKNALIRRGIATLESAGIADLSFRSLAADLGVTKNAPYRHFRDRDQFLGALISEGYRMLHGQMSRSLEALPSGEAGNRLKVIPALGKAYMDFALENRELYRLMNSPLSCTLDDEYSQWPRKALGLLTSSLSADETQMDVNSTAAAWAYIHGLVLLRIDGLFPPHLAQPDWDLLARAMPIGTAADGGR
jgi:AcrR family transcriptional regulator